MTLPAARAPAAAIGRFLPLAPGLLQTSCTSLLAIDGTDRRTDTVPLPRRSPLETGSVNNTQLYFTTKWQQKTE